MLVDGQFDNDALAKTARVMFLLADAPASPYTVLLYCESLKKMTITLVSWTAGEPCKR